MRPKVLYSTQGKLILSFVSVCLLVGVLSLIVGSSIIETAVLGEATDRISQDLNAANEIYGGYERLIAALVRMVSTNPEIPQALQDFRTDLLRHELSRLAAGGGLDFAGFAFPQDGWSRFTLTTPPGAFAPPPEDGSVDPGPESDRVSDRASDRQTRQTGQANPTSEITAEAFLDVSYATRSPVSGTTVLSEIFLETEDPFLYSAARISIIPTERAELRADRFEAKGMAIIAAAPVYNGSAITAIVYGGILLNRNTQIVDRIRDTVFVEDAVGDGPAGTATIFHHDLRISTNVHTGDGQRAIGTQVSKEVKNHVLGMGERWSARAFVVTDWYRTAYDPIVDIASGERIGMLYVGVLDEKYVLLRRQTLMLFVAITLMGIAAAVVLGYILGRILLRPIRLLISASNSVRDGNLNPDLGPPVKDELGILQRTFGSMLDSLKERSEKLLEESETKLRLSEKQASVGRLAAGVAHEINNPLTSVLTFTHLLLEREDLPKEASDDLRVIAESTERVRTIIRDLLDFSRQSELHLARADVCDLVETSVKLVRNQAAAKGIDLVEDIPANLPHKAIDFSQMQSVLINLLLNAIDATDHGGTISISVSRSLSSAQTAAREFDAPGFEISVRDNGKGIDPEHMRRLFDPFFTTKKAGEGTGLGLAVSLGIVERHGGNIRVQSEPGRGSTFVVWLPAEEPETVL